MAADHRPKHADQTYTGQLKELAEHLSRVGLDRGDDSDYVMHVTMIEEMFRAGEISAPDAADELGLSLEEFVSEFVVNDSWLANRHDDPPSTRRELVQDVADTFARERDGVTLRDFVREFCEDHLSEAVDDTALRDLSRERLGILLRRATVDGVTLEDFVRQVMLPNWCLASLRVGATEWEPLRAIAAHDLSTREEFVWNSMWFSAVKHSLARTDDKEVATLDEALRRRHVTQARRLIALIGMGRPIVTPRDAQSALRLWCFARWIRFDHSYLLDVDEALKGFGRVPRNELHPLDSGLLHLTQAVVFYHRENYAASLTTVPLVKKVVDGVEGAERIVVWTTFYEAKALEKRGRYTRARNRIRDVLENDRGGLTVQERVDFELLDTWLAFLLGHSGEANERLAKLERSVADTDDQLLIGDLHSFRGRLARDCADFDQACPAFRQAIETYSLLAGTHRRVARAHINLAITLRDQSRADLAASKCPRSSSAVLGAAMGHLDTAEQIYAGTPEPSKRELAEVLITKALVFHDVGEFERARSSAEKAYRLGQELASNILMGEASRVHAMSLRDPIERVSVLKTALEHARRTDNRRLNAKIKRLMSDAVKRFPYLDREQAARLRRSADQHLTKDELSSPKFVRDYGNGCLAEPVASAPVLDSVISGAACDELESPPSSNNRGQEKS